MYDILVSFLGESKSGLDESLQLQFSCPKCQEREGYQERHKFHLEVNLAKGLYHCWKCSSMDDGMQGNVYKLIRKYGNRAGRICQHRMMINASKIDRHSPGS